MTLRLCGHNDLDSLSYMNEDLLDFDLRTAERIKAYCTQDVRSERIFPDSVPALSKILSNICAGAEDILKALNYGEYVDLKGRVIDEITRIEELNTLSTLLQNAAQVVETRLAAFAGVYRPDRSLKEYCKDLKAVAFKMQWHALGENEKFKREAVPLLDKSISAAASGTVPEEVISLIASYTFS